MSLPVSNLAYKFQLEVKNILSRSNYLRPVVFVCENSKDLDFEIRSALNKTGLVAIIMTPTLNYTGLFKQQSYQVPALSYDVELDIQILENVPVNRAKNKQIILTALDVGVYTQQFLGTEKGKLCVKFNPIKIEQTASDQLVVVDSTFNCYVYDVETSQLPDENLTDPQLDEFYKTYSLLDITNRKVFSPVLRDESDYSDSWRALNYPDAVLDYIQEIARYRYSDGDFWTNLRYTQPHWKVGVSSSGYERYFSWPDFDLDSGNLYYNDSTFIYVYDDYDHVYRYYIYNGLRQNYRTPYIWENSEIQQRIWMFPKNINETSNTYLLTGLDYNYLDKTTLNRGADRLEDFTLNDRKFEFILQ